MNTPFTGSYTADDVEFLLTPIELEDTPVEQKEALIQSGRRHYSDMLTHETPPSEAYLALFHEALAVNGPRMAAHLLGLAERIRAVRPERITLVSLARAGTPVGVLLKHLLARFWKRPAAHYSISIIRDRGLDANALRHILARHSAESLVFVDGWTGKGVIARELETSLAEFAVSDGIQIKPDLFVLADLSGSAAEAACAEDYLIPSSVLNATVSGLVSRSLWRPHDSPGAFHGCVYYQRLEPYDLSRYFVDTLLQYADEAYRNRDNLGPDFVHDRKALQAVSHDFLETLARRYGITHYNYIKPGIGEATRVLLRRGAGRLLLRDPQSPATRHLHWLAESRSVPVDVHEDLPYYAVALINEVQ